MTQPRLPDKRTNYQKNTRGSFQGSFAPIVYRDRDPTSGSPNVDLRDPFKGRMYPVGQQWMNTTDNLLWILVDVTANTPTWQKVDMNTTGEGIDTVTGDDATEVGPDVSGNINFTGETVANATNSKPVYFEGNTGTFTENLQVQVGSAIAEPSDKNDAGLSSYDLAFFTQNSNGWVSWKGAAGPQIGAYNLGLTYSSGTATIKGADGNDLSATNPAYVTLPSNVTVGTLVTYKITSNFTFDDADGASSVFAGSLFGFNTGDDTSTVAQAASGGSQRSGIIFYLYAVADNTDSNLTFFVCPSPSIMSTVTLIFNAGSGDADNRFDMLTLQSVTIANYQNCNSVMIGCFNANLNGSDDWEITDVDQLDGFGIDRYYVTAIGIPLGTKGASANSVFIDNGGTAPTINTTTSFARYKIDHQSRTVNEFYRLFITGSPAGAVNMRMINAHKGGLGQRSINVAGYLVKTGTNEAYPITIIRGEGDNSYYYTFPKNDGTSAQWQYEELDSGDLINLEINYGI